MLSSRTASPRSAARHYGSKSRRLPPAKLYEDIRAVIIFFSVTRDTSCSTAGTVLHGVDVLLVGNLAEPTHTLVAHHHSEPILQCQSSFTVPAALHPHTAGRQLRVFYPSVSRCKIWPPLLGENVQISLPPVLNYFPVTHTNTA